MLRTSKHSPGRIVVLLLIFALSAGSLAAAQGPDTRQIDPFSYLWDRVESAGKFDNPLFVTHAGDESGRLFVVEQGGLVWILKKGTLQPEPFLDTIDLLTREVVQGGYTERGLLGLAFDPRYSENGRFFLYYINGSGDTALARFHVRADNPDLADPNSGVLLLTVKQPGVDHNGGMIAFGPDGYLYVGLGDGGGQQGDPAGNGQNLGILLGKILRLDVNVPEGESPAYRIPPDNPFVRTPGALPEVWAFGLRNPWRFSFDRKTGDMFIGDVGWGNWEEINYLPAGHPGGANFGWASYEATHPVADRPALPDAVMPMYEYGHMAGCSVTGGYVYRGRNVPDLDGVYIFGDYCNGRTWMSYPKRDGAWETIHFKLTSRQISSFGEDEQGEIYMVDYKGWLYRLRKA